MKFSLGLAAALFLPVLVNAGPPSNIDVQVAPDGQLVYSPYNFAAMNGTTVTFYFPVSSTLHSVTQGSFDKPCVYLAASGKNPAGFDSGLQSGKIFTLMITNDQEPVFFFCKTSFHCGLGMVGAINAPATGQTFDAFLAAAKALGSNEIPLKDNGPVTGGVGVVATGTPVAIPATTPASSPPKSMETKSSASSPSTSMAPSSQKSEASSSQKSEASSSQKSGASSSQKVEASSSQKVEASSSQKSGATSSQKAEASSPSKAAAPNTPQPSAPSKASDTPQPSAPSKAPDTPQPSAPSKAPDTPQPSAPSKAPDTPQPSAPSKAPDTPQPSAPGGTGSAKPT